LINNRPVNFSYLPATNNNLLKKTAKKWYDFIPHPVVMLFGIIVLAALMSYFLPAGSFDRELIDGRSRVIPGTFTTMEQTPIGFLDVFRAFSTGFKEASDIIFLVLMSGVMFGILEKSRMIENVVGTLVKSLGLQRKYFIVTLITFVYGLLGVAVGYENMIALIPIAAVVSLALGGDLVLAAGMSVGAVTVGFGLSPINPYTVGIGHQIAEMQMFSGAGLRSLLCFGGLSALAWYNIRYFKRIDEDPSSSLGLGLRVEGFQLSQAIDKYSVTANNWLILSIFVGGLGVMLYGIFQYGWSLREITSIFILVAIVAGVASRIGSSAFSNTALQSIALVAPGAFMIGYARTISVLLEQGNINDTIAYQLSEWLQLFPTYAAAVLMSVAQSGINLFIPSGSGQALATLPIMIPVGDVLGLTRQTTILAFQIGDGVTNLFNPTLGGLIAMLSLCRVPFDRWLRFIFPVTFMILTLAWLFLLFSVGIGWS
jgi:uncharacterized ion transporter superfamily protein YfcC